MTIDTEIDGDNEEPYKYTEKDAERYENEQTQRALEREIRRAKREAVGYVSQGKTVQSSKQVQACQKELREFLKDKPYLQRQYDREKI
jgi:hypothetical protein